MCSLKSLEDENAQLKCLLAEAMLDNAVLKDILGKNWRRAIRGEKRRFMRYRASRSTCHLTDVDSETVRREHPPDNQNIPEEMKQLAAKQQRFGYRRTGVLTLG